jgi:hypothetical protein
MLKKYTRSSLKLFGLKFHQPLFGRRTVRAWDLEDTATLPDPANAGLVVENYEEQVSPGGFESGRRLRRRKRETH